MFKELAEKVVSGQLDVESWLQTDLSTKELKKEMKKVKGVGNYAAETLLKLLGRYDGLALDSMLRGSFYKAYREGIVCEDAVAVEVGLLVTEVLGLVVTEGEVDGGGEEFELPDPGVMPW